MRARLATVADKLVLLVALVPLAVQAGCIAYQRPPELTPEERQLLTAAPLPYAVTVAWWDASWGGGQNPEAYATSLAKLVTPSGAFRSARYERSATPGGTALVATSTGAYCNTAVIPLWSIISVGIIPTIFDDESCQGMLLRRSATAPADSGIRIGVHYRGRVIMGWLALFAGLRPGWGFGDAADDERFRERFVLAVLQHRAEIDRLARP